MSTRTTHLEQATAELYVEAQVYARRSRTDPRFTEAQRRAARAELGRLCGNTAALLRLIDAHNGKRPGG
jgi:hypothetical protein